MSMFITTENKCTFKIGFCHIDPHRLSAVNNNLWGEVFYDDSNTSTVKDAYEQYLWSRLLNDCPEDRFKNKTQYNPYTSANDRHGGRFFDCVDSKWFDDDQKKRDDDDGNNIRYFEKISRYVSENLTKMTKYKKCVKAAMAIMAKEGYLFEPFQLSVLYEHLFFYLNEHDPGILRLFIAAMQPYFLFEAVSIDHVVRMYTKKHYVSIIPRRHGKTLIIYAVIAACLIAFPNLTVLAVAQSKNIINTTKKKICGYMDFWTHNVAPGSLSYSFPSQDNVQISYYNGGEGETRKRGGGDSLLVCVSAHNDNSLRGPDPQMCIVDETMCIKPNRFNSILALGQKKMCKVGFLSSPTPESKDLLLQFTTKLSQEESGTNFYHINYFCGSLKHAKYSVSQEGCVNMVFFKPRHITFTSANKTLTEIMTCSTTCYDGELGIIREDEIDAAKRQHSAMINSNNNAEEYTRMFSSSFYDFYRSPDFICYEPARPVDDALFIYLDPAFNASTQSGIGLACSGMMSKGDLFAIYYMSHRLIAVDELIAVNKIIFYMLVDCVTTLRKRLGHGIKFFITIENNSQMSNVANIYQKIRETWPRHVAGYMYYTSSKKVDIMKQEVDHLLPGYGMTASKRKIISSVMALFNGKKVKVSAHMPCDKNDGSTIKNGSGLNPLQYFLSECRTFRWVMEKRTYLGKIKRIATDDLVIAVVMSIYFASAYGLRTDDFVRVPARSDLPWRPITTT